MMLNSSQVCEVLKTFVELGLGVLQGLHQFALVGEHKTANGNCKIVGVGRGETEANVIATSIATKHQTPSKLEQSLHGDTGHFAEGMQFLGLFVEGSSGAARTSGGKRQGREIARLDVFQVFFPESKIGC
jgi:hypothetical protein